MSGIKWFLNDNNYLLQYISSRKSSYYDLVTVFDFWLWPGIIYFVVFVCNSCGEKQPNETGSHHPLHTCFHYG